MKNQIEKFENETNIKLDIKDSNPYYGGSLDLRCTGITSLPENLTVGGYLDLENCTGITSLPENLTVGDYLDLRGTGITSLPENLTVGGSLYLRGTGITSLPENLTVGGPLYLENCTGITSLPENLTVGGSLYLRGTGITSLPENLTVGGSLDLRGTGITNTNKVIKKSPNLLQWRNGKFIKVDGIFSEVISTHGNVYKVRQIGKTKEQYIVTDGNQKYAHGDTISKAKEDLIYKISNRDKSAYEKFTTESILSFEEAIECYRIITGACSSGTKMFVENILPKREDSYSIAEMIEVTKGQYGNNIFRSFFINKIK